VDVTAEVRFERDEFRGTRITKLRSEPPLVLCETTAGLMMLGAAAGPLGGDRWALRVCVGSGCDASISSVAATVAQPGLSAEASRFEIDADVESQASLEWCPEPLVVSASATHRTRINVELAASSRLSWREIVVLGRHRQPPGRAMTRWRVRRDAQPLLAHDLDIGAGAPTGWDGPAVLAGSRVLGSQLIVDPDLADVAHVSTPAPEAVTVYQLAGPGVLIVARGDTTLEVTTLLTAACDVLRQAPAGARP
jgi:urease accessory protein